ncbi:hypothetical protein NMY22_g8014 [Coprinellus aureogranulatus]|nr:hypothetical protein NMY22_g8014 [Coprinellus aureogranulatus]
MGGSDYDSDDSVGSARSYGSAGSKKKYKKDKKDKKEKKDKDHKARWPGLGSWRAPDRFFSDAIGIYRSATDGLKQEVPPIEISE